MSGSSIQTLDKRKSIQDIHTSSENKYINSNIMGMKIGETQPQELCKLH